MLTGGKDYETIYRSFAWDIPACYKIGVDCANKWAARDPTRTALILLSKDGQTTKVSFAALARESNRAANLLAQLGVKRGQRVAILLSQGLETALAHLAVFKLGAISVPLFSLFGEDALRFRLSDSGASILITNREGAEKVADLRQDLPALSKVLSIDGGPAEDWSKALEIASDRFTPAATLAEDPAIIIYTSGTTGPPKGALHAQRTLLGHLPGVEMPQEFFPKPGDLFWTPADWAWIGGLFDVLLPSLHHGVPVLAYRMTKFDPQVAYDLMARHQVRNSFLPPTALKLLRAQGKAAAGLNLRSIGSGGETLGGELLDWGRTTFGVTINEFYGQTECNLVVANSSGLMPVKAGSMGRPVPGHQVAIIDKDGAALPPGSVGAIAIKRPDPVMFLGYWNNEAATAKKFIGDWLVTGDEGFADKDGYLHFLGRDDDVITSAGYRIGPGEIEDCLLRHPAVRLAAAMGVPDPLRTEIVKAFIVLHTGFQPSDALAKEIQAHVKTRLAAHEYPREIEFLDSLPMTATGKVMRRELRQRPRS